jgi:hypothetical protein
VIERSREADAFLSTIDADPAAVGACPAQLRWADDEPDEPGSRARRRRPAAVHLGSSPRPAWADPPAARLARLQALLSGY